MIHAIRSAHTLVLRAMVLMALALPFHVSAGEAHVAPVNINTASAESLSDALDGVGLVRAHAIVAYRESNGPFARPDDLVKVKGIGVATVDKNRVRIIVE